MCITIFVFFFFFFFFGGGGGRHIRRCKWKLKQLLSSFPSPDLTNFRTSALLFCIGWLRNYHLRDILGYPPVLNGNIQSCDPFRPITHKQNLWIKCIGNIGACLISSTLAQVSLQPVESTKYWVKQAGRSSVRSPVVMSNARLRKTSPWLVKSIPWAEKCAPCSTNN